MVGHGVGNDIPMDAQLGQFLKKQFLLNKLPANTIQEIALLAQQGGAHHMRGLSKLGNNGNACKNISRDLMRASMQNISVPKPYMVTIPITLPKTKLAALVEHPVLLPSEIIAWMLCNGKFSLKEIVNMQEAQPVMHNRLQDKCKKFHLPETSKIPIGLHGDGVPFQKSTHKHSTIEVLSWNLLFETKSKRVLFSCLPKDMYCKCGCSGRHTLDALLEVLVWDLNMLLGGISATIRHDGHAWLPTDAERQQHSGKPLGFYAILMVARGDWPWYWQIFNFPAHNAQMMCWRCKATSSGDCAYFNSGENAPWREQRYKVGEFLNDLIKQGVTPCILFSLPTFTVDDVAMGTLHVMDLGVTAYCLGNVLYEALDYSGLRHSTREGRCCLLWDKLRVYYHVHKIPNQLQGLTISMIRAKNNPPKMRGKGKINRYLVRFALELAWDMHNLHNCWHTQMVLKVMNNLSQLYSIMKMNWCPDLASKHSMDLMDALVDLAKESEQMGWCTWSVKPKYHLMEEMYQYQSYEMGNPDTYNEYLDEDFVGQVAKVALRRGGWGTHRAHALGVMSRYRALLNMWEI